MNFIDKPEKYVYLEHPTDLKIQSFGDTLEDALVNYIEAMFATVKKENTDPQTNKQETITTRAQTLTGAIFDFLEQCLYILDTKNMVTNCTNIAIKKTHTHFTITAQANLILADAYIESQPFKSVTYHQMSIEALDSGKIAFTCVIDV
ncbi:MAG: archease [Candidatus Woesearchaeota archaeon]